MSAFTSSRIETLKSELADLEAQVKKLKAKIRNEKSLERHQQECYIYRHWNSGENTLRELAEEFDISASTVKTRYDNHARWLKRLRRPPGCTCDIEKVN